MENVEALRNELGMIDREKKAKTNEVIQRAIRGGVHITLLVTSKMQEVYAWTFFESLGWTNDLTPGFEQTDCIHVQSIAQDHPVGHLLIKMDYLSKTF